MSYQAPAGTILQTHDRDQTIFMMEGHTVKAPRLLIFDRKLPEYKGGRLTVPTYRVRVIRGVLDADDQPLRSKITMDISMRWPTGAANDDIKSDLSTLASVLSDASFQDDAIIRQQLPTSSHTA